MSKIFQSIFNKNVICFVLFFCLAMISVAGLAVTTVTISQVQTHITTAVGDVSTIIMDVATVSGAGFVFASFFKFHQHKQQPTQVPLSNGVVLLLVGAGLCVFPHILGTGTKAIFGTGIVKAGSTTIRSIVTTS